MYQVNVKAENLVVSDLGFIKKYLRIENDYEDSLIEMFATTAIKHIETYCNTFITIKTVEITSSKNIVELVGTVNQIVSVKIDGVATTAYDVIGNTIKYVYLNDDLVDDQLVTIEYTTLEKISDNIRIFMAQKVADLYGRNEDKKVVPDYALINDIKRLALC